MNNNNKSIPYCLFALGVAVASMVAFTLGSKSVSSVTALVRHGISSNLRFSESITANGKVFTSGQIGAGANIQEATLNALNDVGML